MERLLEGKVAIVTGGGTGIGEAISKLFAKENASVIVCGLPDDPVDEVVKEIQKEGGRASSFKGDISSEGIARDCVNHAVSTFGKLDILINNAGVFPAVGFIQEFPTDAFQYLVKNNILSTFMMTKHAIPELQKTKGCIVTAGSEAGMEGDPQNAPYSGTKGFNHAFTKAVAGEQAQFGVRANVVAPGPIDTSWMQVTEGPMTLKMKAMFKSAIPMGRMGTVEEVANVYLFLASPLSSYVTGAIYPVDGGISISKGPMAPMADNDMSQEPEGELQIEHAHEGHTEMRE